MISKIILLILIFKCSLPDSVETSNDLLDHEGHRVNFLKFCKVVAPKLKSIMLEDSSFVQKKRDFFKLVLEPLVPTKKKSIISLVNQLIYVYGRIPENFQTLAVKIYEKYVEGKFKFDEDTFEKIVASFNKQYERGNMMKMWNSKNDFDRTIPAFREIFYVDYEDFNESSEVEKNIIAILKYIFGETPAENFHQEL
ncbi:unnamed protein product [Caenorhabditis angaria]|uniref:SPK domain-containing protein n=1 Tax=Caenorhabditis angaria TaxID=860376 RepID=A0A9P1N9F5_9PELO|nr:unnamed protein product [Caenorhabditis angaria]